MKLTAELIEAFSARFMFARYDEPRPTPEFHIDLWELYASDAPQIAAAAPRNHAKAQSLDCSVLTMDGWKRIGDLEVGDEIIGSDGRPTKVTDLHPISEMPLYRLTTKDGRSTLCNGDHLWMVMIPSNMGDRWLIKSTEELLPIYKRGRANGYDEYRCFLPAPKPIQWSGDEKFHISPYVLGVWLGDGHTAGGRITTADPEIFEYFDRPVKKQSGRYLYGVEGLTSDLRHIRVLGNKHVPSAYLYGTESTRVQLLRGLMDTDGTVHQDGKIAYFCNTNTALIDAVVFLIRSLGGVANVSEHQAMLNGKPCKMAWIVSVKFDKNFCPFQLRRKRTQWIGADAIKLTIVDITPVDPEPARCITVDAPDGLYVTDDFLLTHNSTSLTHDFILANMLWRIESYCVILGSSEEMAAGHLQEIATELRTNAEMVNTFEVTKFLVDSKTEIVVQFKDGEMFKILARGAEQKLRGLIWNGKRPGLVVADDLEDDEQVESKERREKFRKWFFRAAKQALRDGGRIRVHGTILHEDSLLARLMKNKTWVSRLYKAHAGFDDFSKILWPEKFPETRLRAIRQEFIEEGDAPGYSQEYLNDPYDNTENYFRSQDFLKMTPDDHEAPKIFVAAIDPGISKRDKADPTAIAIGGKDVRNLMHVVDVRQSKWDTWEIIEEIFTVDERYGVEFFVMESGQIALTLMPVLEEEMRNRNHYLNVILVPPVGDKAIRARPLQKRMRAGSTRWDKDADWYADTENEMRRFTGFTRAAKDNRVDALAWLAIGMQTLMDVDREDFEVDDDTPMRLQQVRGRSAVTGY